MSLNIKIDNLPEPKLVFGANEMGVEPRRTMAKYGAADKSALKDVRIGIVGTATDAESARTWLLKLNTMAVAREKNARRYPNWPGAAKAFGVRFVVEDRFVRPVAEDRLSLALSRRSATDQFEELLELFDAKVQALFAMLGPIASWCAFQMNWQRCGSAIQSLPPPSVKPWSGSSEKTIRLRCLSFSPVQRS